MATRELVAPLATNPIMSGRSIPLLRHLKHLNMFTSDDFIDSSRQTIARQYHFRLFQMLSDYFVFIIFYHLSNVSGQYKWGMEGREGDGWRGTGGPN